MAERLSILIAEDNAADRMLLSTIVSRQGHRVLTASNGLEAVALFEQERPQLVLMDALMPVMDGFEAARRIKHAAGEELVPIIFLTSLTEGEALVRCLEAGGDDFLAKPYNRVILEAKIKAMDRLRRLQETVLQQRDLISRHNEHLLNEQRVAKAVFDKVAHSGCLDAPNIRYLQSPYAVFNGDLLLAAFKPSGSMHVLLGDFTGHGLPAAIGAMPLAEVFHGMTAKGYSLAEVLREINAKLKRILPRGVFCCAAVLNISFQRQVVEVWNGGLPDGYLLQATGQRIPLVSRHLPLGVLEPGAFNDKLEVYPLAYGDRVFLLSDGVLEACNKQGELFGEERLLDVFAANRHPQTLFAEIQQALLLFSGAQQDDVSLLEVSLIDDGQLSRPPLAFADSGQIHPLDWSASFEFRGETLRHFNPLPFLLQLLLDVQGLRPQGGALFSVLAELYSNALEHGVLGLDSALKADAAGFAEYYRLRSVRLAALADGFVRFHLQLLPEAGGGRLIVCVQDSGPGFDAHSLRKTTADARRLSGRGLALVEQLSERCRWGGGESGVCVEFSWQAGA
ncbi:fused response regulator/phosphatase [Pseudomonas sp. HMWF032]|uniref:fused response regulator/phosphatase n=1 Tax=unclassified Pseudomonas TaxID=196821 RepID=UPI000D35A695|nr:MULTISPECIES: fused response regulator/phosphatase [unclassified Pseudomonas]PTS82740.1 fused response regulator/phosphatase [Pseudomonas sp. HMWF032]PTT72831.1 fused response regulator/phosphatase [Pseudomonas sp. HMWF010]WAC43614.1 fused response regulator/phosphatase [Pseudomonas sp. SL4(2022)]